jgi:hypothetical protein
LRATAPDSSPPETNVIVAARFHRIEHGTEVVERAQGERDWPHVGSTVRR